MKRYTIIVKINFNLCRLPLKPSSLLGLNIPMFFLSMYFVSRAIG